MAGSSYIHENIQVGDAVRTRGPRNHFPLVDAPSYLFIGGGIGVTPMVPMLGEVIFDKNVPWTFYYGGRTRASMAFRDRLEALGVVLWPQDEKGLLPLDEILGNADPDTAVYCCGPEPLIAAVEETCERLGRSGPACRALRREGRGHHGRSRRPRVHRRPQQLGRRVRRAP